MTRSLCRHSEHPFTELATVGLRHGNVCENRVDARFPRWRRVDRLSSQRVFQPVDARLEQPVKPGFGAS